MDEKEKVIDEILRKIPRPNYSEMPSLYEELDRMGREIGRILVNSDLFEPETLSVRFDKSDEGKILKLITQKPEYMIRFFVMVCGLSVRELERLHGIKNVYSVRDPKSMRMLAEVVKTHLNQPLHIETLLYKFYKNWEEHQKRHYRGHTAEKFVIDTLKNHGYYADKVKVVCKGKEREIDCAIPPDPANIRVAIIIRHGVFRDLVKRAKEYSAEFDDLLECYPNIKFVVVYFISPHERSRIEEIRLRIAEERREKKPYDAIILTLEELETVLIRKLEEWNIPKGVDSLR